VPIGVFDSGLGGLTVLAKLRAALPEQAFLYLGDNRNAPYGPRPGGEIIDLSIAATQALFDQGCELVILACNTASTVALRAMQEYWVPADRRVLGVTVPVIEAIVGQSWHATHTPDLSTRVLLFGTPATVASGAFTRETKLRATGVEVCEVACPGLVDALEAGDHAAAEGLVRRYVAEGRARMPEPDAVVLGCTHYPLQEPTFRAALPPGATILNQGDLVAAALRDYLVRYPRFAARRGTRYLTTGDPEAVARAARAFLDDTLDFTAL
jgi:glutamate racemase